MVPVIREVYAKNIVGRSGIEGIDHCINPYTGCYHGCHYCYATFMKRFSGHKERWGEFVDVKVNAHEALKRQLRKITGGKVMIGSVTDPYQPVEAKYRITRECLKVLSGGGLSVSILTKSPLVLRDVDVLKILGSVSVGLTITTDDDLIRREFEPHAPTISSRIRALKGLKEEGISTFVFIGPVLPMDPEALARRVAPYADEVLIDTMNYPGKTRRIYEKKGLMSWTKEDFLEDITERLEKALAEGKCGSVSTVY